MQLTFIILFGGNYFMRLISINSLKPGEKMAVSFYTSSGNKFLSENVVASDFIIEKLKNMKMELTYINDERFPDIIYKSPLNVKTVADSVAAYKMAMEAMSKDRNLNEEAIKEACKTIADDIKSAGIPINTINASFVIEEPLISHAIKTAMISVAMGIYLGYNFAQLCDLSLAGFIHDFGRENVNSDENVGHTEKAFEVLRKHRLLNLNSSIVVYQHHENLDGSGFPRGLKGMEISEFARIVSVADYFDTNSSGQRGRKIPFEKVYNEIIENVDKKFDTIMVNAFSRGVQIYNVGTMVLLNNGSQGIVVSQNQGNPLRPTLRLFSESLPEYSEYIDLSQFDNRQIIIQEALI